VRVHALVGKLAVAGSRAQTELRNSPYHCLKSRWVFVNGALHAALVIALAAGAWVRAFGVFRGARADPVVHAQHEPH